MSPTGDLFVTSIFAGEVSDITTTMSSAGMGLDLRFTTDVLDRFGGSGLHWAASGGHLEVPC